MAKDKVRFVCTACGGESASWSGKCFSCNEWNTLEEHVLPQSSKSGQSRQATRLKPTKISAAKKRDVARLKTNISDVDDLLGGGIVTGSVNLLAGQPGMGKSTILLQVAHQLAKKHKVLYVSGEESTHQVAIRAERLGVASSALGLVASNSTDSIVEEIEHGDYDVVIIDSIQTVACEAVASAAGSVAQITNSTKLLTMAAKSNDTALVLVGHVTKEGSIAGPKLLEHIVDVVLQLDGDRYGGFKVLRAVKNRYGSTEHSAIFEMKDSGLELVTNPSAALLAERQVSDGSVVFAALEGTRPLLVEVQALTNRTNYGYAKRAGSGIDLNRINVLIAMLERRTKLKLGDLDVYVNIVGGLRVTEPAADLAICMAIASAAKGMQLSDDAVVFGEVGLSGEIRHVPHLDKRATEAKKLGFSTVIGPNTKSKRGSAHYHGVANIRNALNTFLS
jgi:DNA repair protein RadA/Sms